LDSRKVGARGFFLGGGKNEGGEPQIGFFQHGRIKNGSRVVSDPREQSPVDDIGRHFSFELSLANEEDNGAKKAFRKIQVSHQGSDMKQVLMQRILKPAFVAVDLLRPLALFFGTEYPAFVVLGLDDENAEGGDDDMVDLLECSPKTGPSVMRVPARERHRLP